MERRIMTAQPSTRLMARLQTLKNVRIKTDVTFFARKQGSGGTCMGPPPRDRSSPSFSFAPRPATTIGSFRHASKSEPPPNFSWIDRAWLAACAMPTTPEHYRYLNENGIRHVISLMIHKPQGAVDSIRLPKLNHLKIRIEDFCAPTLEQIKHFIKLVEDANDRQEAVVVHCAQGRGRTGTMVACYLVKHKKMSAKEALDEVRRLRPGSVETHEQEKAIEHYYHYLRSQHF